ncbi:MAG TPA: dTDP-glucose 4,6-dehydratase [Patescibacteria group bacterium]|nr:dTDP-glucose 4,6-dehydratase [Patescibacteria group bacterium]
MRYLITGGAGFMGSNFIKHILKTQPDASVLNLDKLTYAGNVDNVKEVENDPRYTFQKGDITNREDVESAFSYQPDVVVNFAAETHVDRSIMDPAAFVMTDVIGTHTLLEAAKKYKVEKYIQISTDEVYGHIEGEGYFTEDTPFRPRSPYSASKAGADHLVQSYFTTYGLPTIVTHSCNVYGPHQHPEKFMPLFITNLLEGKKVPLYGDGQQVREYIFIDDYCRALAHIITHGTIGEAYNISAGHSMKNKDVALMIISALGKDESSIVHVNDRPGHDVKYAVNADKLKALGWNPEFDFEQGLQKKIQWYKENEWHWKKVKQSPEFVDYYKRQYPDLV